MKIFCSLLVFCSLMAFMPVQVKDVTMPDSFMAGKEKLILNGTGIRSKYFIDLYYGALYLKRKEKDPKKIVDANEEMSMKIHIVSSHITNEKMEGALRDGFKTSMGGNSAPLEKEIDDIVKAFSEKIKVGDEYDLTYIVDKGIVIRRNGKERITIPGYPFKKALFGIWFGPEPADEDLEQGLLGNN